MTKEKNFWKKQETIVSVLGVWIAMWIYAVPTLMKFLMDDVENMGTTIEIIATINDTMLQITGFFHGLGSIMFGLFVGGFILSIFGIDLYWPLESLPWFSED